MIDSNISKKMQNAEYQIKLSETLTSMIKQLKNANSESTVASIFENNLYYFIKTYFEKEIPFYKEAGQSFFRHNFLGRMDAFSNGLIIEYKDLNKLEREKDKESAINQVKKYLEQLYGKIGNGIQAILTNGKKICYFYFSGDNIKVTPFKSLDIKDIDRIVQVLLDVGTKQFSPHNIVTDFKLDSSTGIVSVLAKSLYNTISKSKTAKTNMLFEEWEVLFRLSENDKGKNQDIVKRRKRLSEIFDIEIDDNRKEYEAIYVLQTTYAIIVKLIACKVIYNLEFNEEIIFFSDLSIVDSKKIQNFMSNLEDGYVFSSGGIKNLLEGDFYSWYADDNQWNKEIFISIKNIITELENYSSSKFTYEFSTIDIFKDLYMEIMPNELRHSLGEYFTPSWLADNVVKKSIKKLPIHKKDSWKAIDPCCGSGVFVVSLIREIQSKKDLFTLTSEEKSKLLDEILQRVQGIDLNPLSVLTSRVSYFLAILPLLENQKIEIPIYLGDSADIPQKKVIEKIECYHYSIDTKKGIIDVNLPCSFVESNAFFERMYMLQTTIKAEDSELLNNQFLNDIGEENLNDSIKRMILELSKNLVDLHKHEWDGIWIRIISNYMLVGRINKIDLILGNPPWVKWEFLPQNYAEKIKSLCIDRKLFSGQTYMGAIALNLCALIANVTSDEWLTQDGVLAFLMPKTIMTQDSYAGFRNFYLKDETRMYLHEIDDWSSAGDPFIVTTEKFLTYYYKKEFVNYSNGIPINYYHKKRNKSIKDINLFHDNESVKEFFIQTFGIAYQLDIDRTGFTMIPERNFEVLEKFKLIIGTCDYKARSGVEFTPAEVYLIEPVSKSNEKGLHYFKTSSFENSVYKSKYDGKFELETTYISPVVKSPYIKKFKVEESDNYCIFPYKHNDRNSIPLSKLITESNKLANYLINNKSIISKQSSRSLMIAMGDDFYSLSKIGAYTFAKHKVVFRDNTILNAAVIKPINTPWGEKVIPICAKHCPYISMDKNNNFITEDEAYYICGILNTDIVERYFKYTYSGRSYSINFNIKLPKYSFQNKKHLKIVELSKKATVESNEELINSYRTEIEMLYLNICK